MTVIEQWVISGSGSERLLMSNGVVEVKTSKSPPFTPAKDSNFSRLKNDGRVKLYRKRDGDIGVTFSTPEDKGIDDLSSTDLPIDDMDNNVTPEPLSLISNIDNLDIPNRVKSSLISYGIETVGELAITSKEELMNIEGVGKQSYRHITDSLEVLDIISGE